MFDLECSREKDAPMRRYLFSQLWGDMMAFTIRPRTEEVGQCEHCQGAGKLRHVR